MSLFITLMRTWY